MWKKNCLQKDDDGKKCLQRHICSKKMFAEDNFSCPYPFKKNNGPSLMGTSYLDVLL